jgi:hypothetical protein
MKERCDVELWDYGAMDCAACWVLLDLDAWDAYDDRSLRLTTEVCL